MEERFFADSMLGRLAKWLRILGYDAQYGRARPGEALPVQEGWIRPDPERTFRRCPVCNRLLEKADPASARDRVPDYVFHRHAPGFRRCPACDRYYWHGSHRERMRAQLEAWGITGAGPRLSE